MKMKKLVLLLSLVTVTFIAAAQKFDPRKVYTIATPEGYVIDNKESIDAETHMFLAALNKGSASQAWQIRSLGGDTYLLVTGEALVMDIQSYSGRTTRAIRTSIG